MALMNCPECNKEISDKAPTCVGCGTPISEQLQSPPHSQSTNRPQEVTVKQNDMLATRFHMSAKTVLYLILAVVVIVVALVVFVQCTHNDWFGTERTVAFSAHFLETSITELSELVTLTFRYRDVGTIEDERWFARARVILQYGGEIKYGVNMGEVTVDVAAGVITVRMPQAHIVSHEFFDDAHIIDERGTFTRIGTQDVIDFQVERKEYTENAMAAEGLPELALEYAKAQLEAFIMNLINSLDLDEEYRIRFLTN